MDLMDLVSKQLGNVAMDQITKQIGGNNNLQTANAIQAALPILMQALNSNSNDPKGAESLYRAVEKDHDGSILDNLTDFIGNFQNGPGAGILKHVLGNRKGNAEQFVSQSSGLDQNASGKLLQVLAPVIMGALGKQQRSQGLDVSGLSRLLTNDHEVQRKSNAPAMDMIGRLLDKDGDGDYRDEIADMGKSFIGSLFK